MARAALGASPWEMPSELPASRLGAAGQKVSRRFCCQEGVGCIWQSPGESGAGGTFQGGLHGSPLLLLPALPLPARWSPGPADLGTQLVPQGQAHSSPHGTEKGWLLPGPVPCRGAAGAGMTPLPLCPWVQAGCWQLQHPRHRTALSPRDSVHWHPGTKTPGAGLPGRGCPTPDTPQWPYAPPKTDHTFWDLPWQRGEHPIRGSTRVPACLPGMANACLDASLPA